MIHKATKTIELEFVILENSVDSIYECQKFIQHGHLDNYSCKRAEDAWDEYIDIVKDDGGIWVNSKQNKLARFGDVILKINKQNFEVFTKKEFQKNYSSVLTPILINENENV